jgi:hypothetical protein
VAEVADLRSPLAARAEAHADAMDRMHLMVAAVTIVGGGVEVVAGDPVDTFWGSQEVRNLLGHRDESTVRHRVPAAGEGRPGAPHRTGHRIADFREPRARPHDAIRA